MTPTDGREPKVAVVGATGTIGSQIIELIDERAFACAELKLFASDTASIDGTEQNQESREVSAFKAPADLAGFDIAFLAVPESWAAEIIRAHPGPALIDLSAANRIPAAATLLAPGLTSREQLREARAGRFFAIPHPAAHVLATVLGAIRPAAGFAAATLMLGASAGGRTQVAELFQESAELLNARLSLDEDETQRAFNVLAPDYADDLAAAITGQVAALIGDTPALALQIITVPAFHGAAMVIHLSPDAVTGDWAARLKAAPGILIVDKDESAVGIVDAAGQDAILVRLGQGMVGATLWCLYDNARLAAMCALWIAENLQPLVQ